MSTRHPERIPKLHFRIRGHCLCNVGGLNPELTDDWEEVDCKACLHEMDAMDKSDFEFVWDNTQRRMHEGFEMVSAEENLA